MGTASEDPSRSEPPEEKPLATFTQQDQEKHAKDQEELLEKRMEEILTKRFHRLMDRVEELVMKRLEHRLAECMEIYAGGMAVEAGHDEYANTDPPATSCGWKTGYSGEALDVPADGCTLNESVSILKDTSMADLDLETLSCTNDDSHQMSPCTYPKVATGQPRPVDSRALGNLTFGVAKESCEPGWRTGDSLRFEVYAINSKRRWSAVTLSNLRLEDPGKQAAVSLVLLAAVKAIPAHYGPPALYARTWGESSDCPKGYPTELTVQLCESDRLCLSEDAYRSETPDGKCYLSEVCTVSGRNLV
jgi:hypothetical protein